MSTLLTTGLYSDLTLSFYDECSKNLVCILNVHNSVLYTSGIQFFRNLIDKKFGGPKDKIDIYFNFECYTEEMLHYLFEFLYISQAKNASLDAETVNFIHTHILYFHQLSLYFTFMELEQYCLAKIYQEMSPDLFEKLCSYCLTQNGHRYSIMGDKMELYNRMVQWHQYCIEKPEIPNVMDNHGFLEHYHDNIDNFDSISLPKKYISIHNPHIEYYQNCCSACLYTKKNLFFNQYNVYLGGIRSMDNKKTCYFNLMRSQDKRNHFELYITHNLNTQDSPENQDSMSVDSSHSHEESPLTAPLHTKLTLFSKKLHLDTTSAIKSLGDLTRVLAFDLHDKQDCYEARCGHCHENKPVYILHLSVDTVQ